MTLIATHINPGQEIDRAALANIYYWGIEDAAGFLFTGICIFWTLS